MKLRPYQERCVTSAIDFLRKSTRPIVIDAAPAAGKSYMIAAVAKEIHTMSGGKRVLCIAPSAELVRQNFQKYRMTGERASIFSASAGAKELRFPVVFGTPKTVLNSIEKFNHYSMVVIDEAHAGVTPTIKSIIENMRVSNPDLRVLGLSGTPFRLGTGYIFAEHHDGKMNGVNDAIDPYFYKCVARVTAQEMLDGGFITPMEIGVPSAPSYDTSQLVVEKGQFTHESLHKTFEGKGRLTAEIVKDVVDHAKNIDGGCMLFASTVAHAREILASLPPENSGMVLGDDTKTDRDKVVMSYRMQNIKYLVSVGTLTTGFDVEHTSVIATLRRTMSSALLQQILGRAWRVCPAKPMAYWLDYAGNCDEHFPEGNIYEPEIYASEKKDTDVVPAECPLCGYENEFKVRENKDGFKIDKFGYFLDLNDMRVATDDGHMPAHYGRRCEGIIRGTADRCSYRWTFKECPSCKAENDITARRCVVCNAELVDPNEKLMREFIRRKKDPYEISTDKVLSWTVNDSFSAKGNSMYTVNYVTEYNRVRAYYVYAPETKAFRTWKDCTGMRMPRTITYRKRRDSSFWEILAYNMDEDEKPA